MKAAILAVGSELLGPDRLDTNSLLLAETLGRYGVELAYKAVVGDQLDELTREIRHLLEGHPLLLVTGGLGPTSDDITREAVAAAVGVSLERQPHLIAEMEKKFSHFGMKMSKSNEKQADVPAGALVLSNPRGTAPGLQLGYQDVTIFLFPGVPTELEGLIESALEPWLQEFRESQGYPDGGLEIAVLRTACLAESALEEKLEPFYREFGRGGLSILASPGEVILRLTASGLLAKRRDWLAARRGKLRALLGTKIYAEGEKASLERAVGDLLRARGSTVAIAESCTGGLIAARLTRVPGSSEYFLGGVVSYANSVKQDLLGVREGSLVEWGAVSEQVVGEMAEGVCRRTGADYGVAVSGVAGPGGGTEEKPVGTVFIGLRGPADLQVRRLNLPGDRDRIRRLASQWALDILRRAVLPAAEATSG